MSRSWRDVSWSEATLLAEALCFVGGARIAIQLLAFHRVARQDAGPPQSGAASEAHAALARAVGWAVDAAARRLPFADTCLTRAVAAQRMLRRRGIGSTLYLGMLREPVGQDVVPHAWLRCGDGVVTGGSDTARYVIVGRFESDPGRPRRG